MSFVPYDSDSGSGIFLNDSAVVTSDSAISVIQFFQDSVNFNQPLFYPSSFDSSQTLLFKDSSNVVFSTGALSALDFIKPFTTTIVAAADSGGPAQVWIG